jgi:hypothetical protein
MDADVKLELVEPGGDSGALDELLHHLRLELLQLDVDSVTSVPAAPAPPGSKGVEMAAAAALLVHVKGSVAALNLVVSAVRAWLSRSKDKGLSVKVTIGDRTLELALATTEQHELMVQEFLRSQPKRDR